MKNLTLVVLVLVLISVTFLGNRVYGRREGAVASSVLDSEEGRHARGPDASLASLKPTRPDSERSTLVGDGTEVAPPTDADDAETVPTDVSDVSDVDWRILLKRIRATEKGSEPHRSAWSYVQALGRAARKDLVEGSPGPIAVELEALLRDASAESPFVRGALLLSLRMAYPTELAQALVHEFRTESPGELARAAWLAGRLTEGEGVDLARFEVFHSKAARPIWPVTVLASSDASMLEEALAQLTPTTVYPSGVANDMTRASVERRREGRLTRETIVLALLSGSAREPGPVRDRLLEWAPGTDMSHACIWSLCLSARDDPDLALTLRNMLLGLDPSSSESQLLATLLADLALRGDLVFEFLEATLTSFDGDGGGNLEPSEFKALFAMGDLLGSDDPELSTRAMQLLTDIVLDPTRSDALRSLILAELSVAGSARVPDMIELILISPDGAEVQKWASFEAKFVPEDRQQSMRDTLIDTYSSDLAGDVQLSYVKSLISLGGDDVRVFLSQLAGAEGTSDALRQEIEDYLGY